jgi:hypothetical protein
MHSYVWVKYGVQKEMSVVNPYPCVTHRVELARFRCLRKDIVVFQRIFAACIIYCCSAVS